MSRPAPARCPYCKGPAIIRNSEEVTILHRDIYLDCKNNQCGHRWKASLSFVHSISTPASLGTDITLPVTPDRYRRSNRNGDPPPVPVPA